jgi:hypothetical protein
MILFRNFDNNFNFFSIIIEFSIKPSRDPDLDRDLRLRTTAMQHYLVDRFNRDTLCVLFRSNKCSVL